MHHGGFMDGVEFQRMGLKGIHESGLRRRQQSAIPPKPGFFPRAPAARCLQQARARSVRHAGHTNGQPIQQKHPRGRPRCFGNGGLGRFQHVAEQDGFSGVCHGTHAACVPLGVKHHGARAGFVLP